MSWDDLSVEARIEILDEVFGRTDGSVQAVMDRYRYGEPSQISIPEEAEVDPPGFQRSSLDQSFDFELFLGEYDASEKKITIYKKGVLFVANAIDVDPDRLRHIVLMHEYAHSLHHVGSSRFPEEKDHQLEAYWERKHSAFRKAQRDVKEQIAQLATLLALLKRRDSAAKPEARELNQTLIDAFFRLMQRQKRGLPIPEGIADGDSPRLERKLRLLLDMTDNDLSPSIDHIRRILE